MEISREDWLSLMAAHGITEAMLEEAQGGKGDEEEPVTRAVPTKSVFTNSPLVTYTKYSPNNSGRRVYDITRITVHCIVGDPYIQSLGALFSQSSVQASSNYGIVGSGDIGLFVDECDRSWCSSSYDNDNRAVTIECGSGVSEPYAFPDKVWERLIELCADICKRNGKDRLLWLGDKDKTLAYVPKDNEMVLTAHRWFCAAKSCPGDWCYSRLGTLAQAVTAALGGGESDSVPEPEKPTEPKSIYRVQVGAFINRDNAEAFLQEVKDAGFENAFIVQATLDGEEQKAFDPYLIRVIAGPGLNVRSGPGMGYGVVTSLPYGSVYTVTEEKDGWGKLKSGAGWICLDYTEKV